MVTSNSIYGSADPMVLWRLQEISTNMLSNVEKIFSSRQEALTRSLDPRRSIYDECGFPRGRQSAQYYKDLYDRDAIAARVVEILAKLMWQVQPKVYENEKSKTKSVFEQDYYDLCRSLYTEQSWFQDEEGNGLVEAWLRADIISGIGQYGVIYLGIDDGLPLDQPANFNPGKKTRNLTQIRVFPESLADIVSYDTTESPRKGKPEFYNLTFNDPTNVATGIGLGTNTVQVHWTRVIHIADISHQAQSSDIFATPRMEPVLNHILSLQKPYGASAEGYWKSCFTGLSIETHPSLGGDVTLPNKAKFTNMMEDFQNSLQKYIVLMGMTAKPIAPVVTDPKPIIDTHIEAICIKLDVPIRKFKGSERGELASSDDDTDLNRTLRARMCNYGTPRIIVPTINRLIQLGVLTAPKGYSVHWPDLEKQSDQEKADVATKLTQAMGVFVEKGLDSYMTSEDFFSAMLGFDEEEAANFTKNVKDKLALERNGEGTGTNLLGTATGVTTLTALLSQYKLQTFSEETFRQLLLTIYRLPTDTVEKILADGLPEPKKEALPPVKMKEGEKLVNPNPIIGNEETKIEEKVEE